MEPKINLTLPWCTVCLLVAAAHRAAGGTTARNVDLKAVLNRINQNTST